MPWKCWQKNLISSRTITQRNEIKMNNKHAPSKQFVALKKQNGEAFARAIREECPALLDYEDGHKLLKYAGKDPKDAKKLSLFLNSVVVPDGEKIKEDPECPLVLLDRAGYNAFVVTDRESQDSIKNLYARGEVICTIGTDRWKHFNIIHAVKKNVQDIKRENFKEPKRDDEYGTSVISIQIKDGFVSIKNRYNHSVPHCDSTFGNDLDLIIPGLRVAVEKRFGITFGKGAAPEGFMISGNVPFKVVNEIGGVYYGVEAILLGGKIVDLGEDEYLYEYFIFSMKTKEMRLFDSKISDSFPKDFNATYAGRKSLRVDRHGNLCDGDKVIIGVGK